MRKRKVGTHKVQNNFLDTETGETVETSSEVKHETIVVNDEESFATHYSSVIGALKHLDFASTKVLIWCSLNAATNTNKISLVKPFCEDIGEEYGLAYNTVKNCISKLKQKEILIPIGSGVYRINPKYFWRGNSNQRNRTMKYVLEVECKTAND